MQKTRQAILNYLQNNPGASAGDLSRFLDLTPANIRYHLVLMVRDGLIQISGQRPAGGAGRPISLYDISSRELGNSFTPLLRAVLGVIKDQPDILSSIAKEYAEDLELISQNPITRFNQAIEFLNDLNYLASWEANPDGPRVEFRHCPYGDIAVTNPEICHIDQNMVSMLFELPLVLVQKRVFGKNPYSPCLFQTIQNE